MLCGCGDRGGVNDWFESSGHPTVAVQTGGCFTFFDDFSDWEAGDWTVVSADGSVAQQRYRATYSSATPNVITTHGDPGRSDYRTSVRALTNLRPAPL